MTKYVILLNFYISLLQKHKKYKNKKLNKFKKNLIEHLYHEISNSK